MNKIDSYLNESGYHAMVAKLTAENRDKSDTDRKIESLELENTDLKREVGRISDQLVWADITAEDLDKMEIEQDELNAENRKLKEQNARLRQKIQSLGGTY